MVIANPNDPTLMTRRVPYDHGMLSELLQLQNIYSEQEQGFA